MAKASKEEKEAAKAKAIKNGFDPVAAERVFKMDDRVYKMAQIAGKPAMPMQQTDKLYAEDPIRRSIRPLYATENNKSLFTEVSKSGSTITYDTTVDGRPVIYPVGMDVPGFIRQRSSNSARDMQFAKPSYQSIMKSENAEGFGNQVMTSINQTYTGANRAIGDFKRQTTNKPREYQSNYSNVDIRSSASMINPRSGKPISFGSPFDVSNYKYDTEYNIGMTNMLGGPDAKYPSKKNQRIYRQSEKVQGNIDQAVKNWRSGEKSGLKNLEQGIVHVQPEKPKIQKFVTVDFNAKPSKPKEPKRRSYSDRYGTTRAGDALRGIAKGVGAAGEFVSNLIPKGSGRKTNWLTGRTKGRYRNRRGYRG